MNNRSRKSSHSTYSLPDDPTNEITDMDTSRILKDMSFVRICLDSVYMNDEDEYIDHLISSRSLFGFVLEYYFPSLDVVSTSLKARVRINAKSYNGSAIHFRHRRVVRVKMHPDIVPLWRRESLKMAIYARLNASCKYSVKLMGRCEIELGELVVPPFIICRDFAFNGPGFSASALIKIDLGSHIKSLMERLEMMRNGEAPPELNAPLSGTRSRSRSLSRHGSSRSSSTARRTPLHSLQRSTSPPPLLDSNQNPAAGNGSVFRTNTRSPSPVPRYKVPRLFDDPLKYRIQLTVYSARRLPIFYGPKGEAIAPSTYVTVNGADGRMLSSPVRAATLHPEWNWTESFDVSMDRQNVVVKLWRKCITGHDEVIGFVSIPLPAQSITKNEYEMSDLCASEQAPLITIALTRCDEVYRSSARSSESPAAMSISPAARRTPSPTEKMSREEISERLRRNLNELEIMMAELRYLH
uniref:C2 domain-containing protein n=2 Tax=Parascaris univalens TaxID=6257 RepID=A0A915CCW6_PARUN